MSGNGLIPNHPTWLGHGWTLKNSKPPTSATVKKRFHMDSYINWGRGGEFWPLDALGIPCAWVTQF